MRGGALGGGRWDAGAARGSGGGKACGRVSFDFGGGAGDGVCAAQASAEEPRILFLEDVGTKPYQWDRMLLHLRYAGMLEHVTGIVFGDMRQCVAAEEMALLEEAILHALGILRGRWRWGCGLGMWMGRM